MGNKDFMLELSSLDMNKYFFFNKFIKKLKKYGLEIKTYYPSNSETMDEITYIIKSPFIIERKILFFSGTPYVRFEIYDGQNRFTDKDFEKEIFGLNPENEWFFDSKRDFFVHLHQKYITQPFNKERREKASNLFDKISQEFISRLLKDSTQEQP